MLRHTQLRDRNQTPFRLLPVLALYYDSKSVAERKHRDGYVSDEDYRWFCFFWLWTAPRFEGEEGRRHDYAYKRLGKKAYFRRLERTKQFFENWIMTRFGEYLVYADEQSTQRDDAKKQINKNLVFRTI